MKRKKKIFVLTIFPLFFGIFNYLPAKATSNDAITLESISAVSTTVLTGQNIVMQLEVAVPTGYDWDPRQNYLGYSTKVLLCKTNIYSEVSGIASCNYGSNISQYSISSVSDLSQQTYSEYKLIRFKISGSFGWSDWRF